MYRLLLITFLTMGLSHCDSRKDETLEKKLGTYCKDTEQRASQNDADAQDQLGLAYITGRGCQKNHKLAFEYFQKAAQQGSASAQNNLGVCYATGEGVLKNPELALQWFEKSAAQGWSEAQFNMGLSYAVGAGVTPNLKSAQEWFDKSSHRGIHQKYSKPIANRAKKVLEAPNGPDSEWVRAWSLLGI